MPRPAAQLIEAFDSPVGTVARLPLALNVRLPDAIRPLVPVVSEAGLEITSTDQVLVAVFRKAMRTVRAPPWESITSMLRSKCGVVVPAAMSPTV